MLDHYIWGDATRISPEAPVPVVKRERETDTAGGCRQRRGQRRVAGRRGRAGRRHRPRCQRREAPQAPGEPRHRLRRGFLQDSFHHHEDPGGRAATSSFAGSTPRMSRRITGRPSPARRRWPGCNTRSSNARCNPLDYAKGLLSTELMTKIATMVRAHGGFVSLDPKPSGKRSRTVWT